MTSPIDTPTNRTWLRYFMGPIIATAIAAALVVAFGPVTSGRIQKGTGGIAPYITDSDFDNSTTGQIKRPNSATTADFTIRGSDSTTGGVAAGGIYIYGGDGTTGVTAGGAIYLRGGSDYPSSSTTYLPITIQSGMNISGGSTFLNYMQMVNGATADVSVAGSGRLRYNSATTTFQYSVNGGAWTSFTTGTVTNVTATAPLTSSGGATPDISSSMAQNKLIGRGSASGTGVFQEITLGTNLALSGTTLNATDTDTGITQLTGDVTAGPGNGSQAATIPNNTVTYAKMQDVSAASKLLGRGDSGSGDPQEITLGTGLSMSGTTVSVTASGGATRIRPGGRLSLTSATPVTTSNTSGTTVYYTEYFNDLAPVYDGSTWTPTAFTNLSQTLADTTKSPAAAINEACYDYFLWSDSGTMRCTRGPVWSNTATITVTIATPAVVTWTAHGLHEGSPVIFTTSGALPTGITAGTVYYVTNTPAANTFNISTTIANAAAGTKVNTSGSQSGTHTGTNHTTGSTYITARGTGAGTSELERVNGIWMNKNAITNGPGADRGVYVGTVYVDASGNVNDSDSSRGCWNYFNRINSYMKCTDTTDSWNYSTATWRMANGSTTIGTARVEMVFGMNEDSTRADCQNYGFSSAAGLAVGGGVGLGASNVNSAQTYGSIFTNAATTAFSGIYEGQIGVGKWSINRLEIGNAGGTCTWEGDFGSTQAQSGMIVRGMR